MDVEKRMAKVKNVGNAMADFNTPDEPVPVPANELYEHARATGAAVVTIEVSAMCGKQPISPTLTDSFPAHITEDSEAKVVKTIKLKVDNCKERIDALVAKWIEELS